jgi:hypothetical protein
LSTIAPSGLSSFEVRAWQAAGACEPDGSLNEAPEWINVCFRCLRIQCAGEWTEERASDTGGHSTGFCDDCAKARRTEIKAILATSPDVGRR